VSSLERFREAGLISKKVKEEAYRIVKEGAKILEICEFLEDIIRREGAEPAFPCNIGVNEIAAHYTAVPRDVAIIPPRSIVKVDIGVSLDGYLADTAITVVLDPRLEPLAESTKMALHEAIKAIKPGTSISKIGSIIHKTITGMGFKPIRNLTGHEIKRYNLHAGLSIPNVPVRSSEKLREGHIYAIEPFATTGRGAGEVVSMKTMTIFRIYSETIFRRKLKDEELELAKLLAERFDSLPYTPRWIDDFDRFRKIHERMVKTGRIHGYPVLVEKLGEPVAQFEHTIYVNSNGCEILT